MRPLLALAIAAEVSLAGLLISPTFIDRREHARAIADYTRSPSAERSAIVDQQRQVTARHRLAVQALLIALLAANGFVIHRLARQSKSAGSKGDRVPVDDRSS